MNKKQLLNKNNNINKFLKTKKGQYSLLSILVLSVLLISGLFTFSLLKQNNNKIDTALAALNCPSGSTLTGNQCISNTPSGYTCTTGTVSGTNCVNTIQTCPNDGTVSGGNCIATNTTPVQTGDSCAPTESIPSGYDFCMFFRGGTTIGGQIQGANECNPGRDVNTLYISGFTYVATILGSRAITYINPITGTATQEQINSCYVVSYNQSGSCSGVCDFYYFNRLPGRYTQNYSYPSTPSTQTLGPATPQFTTPVTSGVTYTPEPGSITNLTCTPNPTTASSLVTCTGQATGNPNYPTIPYTGNITVTIDNGGSSVTTSLNPSGSFTATGINVGTIPSSTPVIKTATTNLGGSTPITVNPNLTSCTQTDPCALIETALTYSPTQSLAKRYGAAGGVNVANLVLNLKDTKLEQSSFTTTCTIKYKFRTDTTYRTLVTNSPYNNTTGCTGTLLTASQLLFNVDFEITAQTTNTSTNVTKNYLLYANYDFKAGSIGVTSIGGSGL